LIVPTLICDLGGVLFSDTPQRSIDAWREANGGQLAVSTAAELDDDELRGFQIGLVGESEYGRHLRSRLGWTGSDEDLVELWKLSAGALVLDVLDMLSGLRESGWVLVAAADSDPWREQAWQSQFGWALSLFDQVITSTAVRARRPDPRFFAELIRATPRGGPRLYVDDDPRNISAARRAGLDGHLFVDARGLKAACRSLSLATT
jgi:FMN phosphatase YigB (HAD superfamily)